MAPWDACFSFYLKSFQIFRVIKLAWRMFVFFIHLLNVGKISISLASSGSFTLKNDNIHSFFFSLFWLQILNLPTSLKNKNTRVGPFPWKRSVLQNSDRERTNQSTGICLRLGLPYNNFSYLIVNHTYPLCAAFFILF